VTATTDAAHALDRRHRCRVLQLSALSSKEGSSLLAFHHRLTRLPD
jgi:hypothetical protein